MKREHNIDLMKTLLVVGMVLSHAFSILCSKNFLAFIIIKYINLITFSGFMFIYGYNVYNAYLVKDKSVKLKSILKLLLSFWICSMTYHYFMLHTYNVKEYLNILLLFDISGYTEFLVTFVVLELLIMFFKNGLKIISRNNNYLIIAIIISLLFALMPPVTSNIPYIYLFVKTNTIAFPLFPYLNLFFLGIYFAKNKPQFNLKLALTLAIFSALHYSLDIFNYSPRMPISLTYLLGSYMFIYLYYFATIYSSKRICDTLNKINIIGKNSLNSLVISNVILFIVARYHGYSTIRFTFLVYFLIMGGCYIVFVIHDKYKKNNNYSL